MKYNDFDKRMKNYEAVSKNLLTKRMPVVIRIDGRAFHTFTKGFKKPYDEVLCKAMQETMKYLCENIQGCVLGYTQSDEITLVLVDYDDIKKSSWLDYEVQKICSIVASMTTMKFNKVFSKYVEDESKVFTDEWLDNDEFNPNYKNKSLRDLWLIYTKAAKQGAMFDTRCFNVPENDICNAIIWRQRDAEKNSISSLGQAYFTQKELHKKKSNEIQDMLMLTYNVNWNNVPTKFKRGSSCIKTDSGWMIDNEMPILTKDRSYVESRTIFTV